MTLLDVLLQVLEKLPKDELEKYQFTAPPTNPTPKKEEQSK